MLQIIVRSAQQSGSTRKVWSGACHGGDPCRSAARSDSPPLSVLGPSCAAPVSRSALPPAVPPGPVIYGIPGGRLRSRSTLHLREGRIVRGALLLIAAVCRHSCRIRFRSLTADSGAHRPSLPRALRHTPTPPVESRLVPRRVRDRTVHGSGISSVSSILSERASPATPPGRSICVLLALGMHALWPSLSIPEVTLSTACTERSQISRSRSSLTLDRTTLPAIGDTARAAHQLEEPEPSDVQQPGRSSRDVGDSHRRHHFGRRGVLVRPSTLANVSRAHFASHRPQGFKGIIQRVEETATPSHRMSSSRPRTPAWSWFAPPRRARRQT